MTHQFVVTARYVAGLLWLLPLPVSAQNITILPTVDPAAITAGTPSTVTVSALITSSTLSPVIANGVNLLRVDQNGNTLVVLGALNDSGTNGDAITGDGIFSGQFSFTEATTGQVYIRISSAFKGQLRRSLSPVVALPVVPGTTPTTARPFNPAKIVTDPASSSRVVCNELLVTFNPEASFDAITSTASIVGGSIVGWLPALGVYQIALPSCDIDTLNSALNMLASQPIVTFATKNNVAELTTTTVTPNDPLFPLQWSLPVIQAPYVWALSSAGRAIGIIDTGIDYNHPDLAGHVTLGFDQCASLDADQNCVYGTNPLDTLGHGTGTASIAGARANNGQGMAGAAFSVQLIAEKWCITQGTKCNGTDGTVALAIVDAVNRGARVINLSLTASGVVQLAVNYAINNNRVVVAGAGNSNSSNPVTPATYPGVISVAASDESNQRAIWSLECPGATISASNYGSWVDIYAPGTNLVYATLSRGYDTYCPAGTSWATPLVSATASLMLSVNPTLTPLQVKEIIKSTATNTGNTDVPGGNSIYVVNMLAAVKQAAASGPIMMVNQPAYSAASSPSWYGDNWYQLGTGFSGTLQSLTVKCFTSGGNFGSSRGTLTLNEFSDSAYSMLTNSYPLPSTCGPALADVTSANLNITLLPTRYYRLDTLDSLQNASVRLLGTNARGVAMYDSFVPGVGGVQTHYTFYPYMISNAPPSPPPSCPSAPTAPNGVAYFPFREVFGSGLTINSLGLWTSSDGGVYCCSQSYVTLLSDVQGNPGPPFATSSIITLGYRVPASENVYYFPSPVQIAAGTAFWISFNTGPSTTTNETQVYGTNGAPFLDFIGSCSK